MQVDAAVELNRLRGIADFEATAFRGHVLPALSDLSAMSVVHRLTMCSTGSRS